MFFFLKEDVKLEVHVIKNRPIVTRTPKMWKSYNCYINPKVASSYAKKSRILPITVSKLKQVLESSYNQSVI